jgi:hypothetical protein
MPHSAKMSASQGGVSRETAVGFDGGMVEGLGAGWQNPLALILNLTGDAGSGRDGLRATH